MTRYVSILRGINVGGKRKILMADLKKLYQNLGFSNIITYIQSGNVVFNSMKQEDDKALALQIEQSIEKAYGFAVPVIVRTVDEMKNIVSANPFFQESSTEVERLHLTFLKDSPPTEKIEHLQSMDFTPDAFAITGKDVFVYCSGKYSDTKLSNQYLENKLKTTATTRNWKTVQKLLALAGV